ncbi:MAG: bifunctional folylpolyglutamate synthase/dihydrofolate synthase [Planctomycetes bacterium]|nr:bifunctional folylpolyglutamate synthase/dihydrofolate synthase [Planctomycetota bacterium]
MRRGLAPIEDVCARLGHPERAFRAVHVAGTKGKGTTSALVAAALAKAGLRTGLYTSPHVVRVQERVRIDGRDVGDAELAHALELALDARETAVREGTPGSEATWFDLLTAAAFHCFRGAGVEWAVVECGLGGRLDSTNVVRGEIAVVTNIDLEHVNVLGGTRALIAREKGGIVKPGATLVTGVEPLSSARAAAAGPRELHNAADDAYGVLRAIADEQGVPLVRPASCEWTSPNPTVLERNAALARLVLRELGRRGVRGKDGVELAPARLDDELVRSSALPGRIERFLVRGVRVVIDAAHVPSSVELVLAELRADPELVGKPFCVLALGKDKDAKGILKALAPLADRVLCTTVASGPLVDAETLVREAALLGIAAEKAPDPAHALARALQEAGSERWVLVIGSFYLAGAVRAQLLNEATPWPKATRC